MYICTIKAINNKQKNKIMRKFNVATSTGRKVLIKAENITKAENLSLNLLKNNGDYLEITERGKYIFRILKDNNAEHPINNGYVFSAYEYKFRKLAEGSLFK